MAIKVNIGIPKLKRTIQKELSDEQSVALHGKRLGERIKGELIDMPGYEFAITGGSDKAGFPMRPDVNMTGRKRVLITKSLGNRKGRKGMRLRKTVAGAIISEMTAQVNMKLLKEGKQPLIEKPEGEAPAPEAKVEAGPKQKEEPKSETPQKKPAEKPKEEANPETPLKAEKKV